jgi:hypothetical protein
MRRFAAAAAVVVLAAAGCAFLDGTKRVSKNRPEPPTFSQYHLDGWAWERVDRVLVLPFLNESQYARAGAEARAAFTSELQRLGRFEVIAAAPDDQAVLAVQIHRGGRFDEGAMLELARQTHADVVVHAIITHYSPYPRPRIGLIVQAVGPQEAKVIASVDGLWDTTDGAVAERCRAFYRQRPHPRPSFIARNHVIANDDGFAGELALDSPALFLRWVGHEVALALLGHPVPGVISPNLKSRTAAIGGAVSCTQPECGVIAPDAPVGKVK